MRISTYPIVAGLILLFLLLCTGGSACLVGWLAGRLAVLAFLMFPALAMLVRALRCREPSPWLWFLFGASLAPFIWLALPVAASMILRPLKENRVG